MSHEAYHTEEYRGYTIKIVQDQDGSNPYEDCDGCVPLMIEGGRNFGTHDYGNVEDTIMAALNNLDAEQLEALANTLDGGKDMIQAAKDNAEQYPERGADSFRAHLADEIADGLPSSGNDKLEYLEAIADALGWPCLNTCSRGYSQGDYVDALSVWLPEFGAANRPDATPEQVTEELEAAVKLFGAWAWGDVFGFVIEGPDGTELEDGSCWGFVEPETYPAEKMYVAQEARMVVDADILHRRKTHQEQVKTWIRSKVPLQYRVNA